MKKVMKILMGFPIGVVMLAVSYILIGAIDGEVTLTKEIMKLTDYKYLLTQIVLAGASYVIIAYIIYIVSTIFGEDENRSNLTWKGLGKIIFVFLVIVPISVVLFDVLDRRETLQGYVGKIFGGIMVIILTIGMIVYIIHDVVENRKINKALKTLKERE